MVRPKQNSSSKKPKRAGVDFKKYKHKIGRKLPPPKNATDTTIKSKSIVLPEQSVATERAGVAVGQRGLSLRELLAQTTHHNVKVRRAALNGIKDLLVKNPLELKLHKLVIVEKLRERMLDTDKVVRDMLYEMLKSVILPSVREELSVNIISMLMAFVLNAMTNLAMDIRFMAFHFLELLVLLYPSAFLLHSDMVIDNYIVVLKDRKVYLYKGKLDSIFRGLLNCLTLLDSKARKNYVLNQNAAEGLLQSFDSSLHGSYSEDSFGFSSIIKKLDDLVPILVQYVEDSFSLICASRDIDAQSFESLSAAICCINLTAKIFIQEKRKSVKSCVFSTSSAYNFDLLQTVILRNLQKLWKSFSSHGQFLVRKENEKVLILKVKVIEIIMNLMDCRSNSALVEGDILEFVIYLLEKVTESGSKKILEKQLHPILTSLPVVVAAQLSESSRERLLMAFTNAFEESSADSRLIQIYLSAIEEMLFSDQSEGLLLKESQLVVRWWVFKLFKLLDSAEKYPDVAKAVLELLLKAGRFSLPFVEKDLVPFVDFFCKLENGTLNLGPFTKLPRDCQELAISCLYYYITSTPNFLQMLAHCCGKLKEPYLCLRVAEVLQSAYRAGKLQMAEQLGFLLTLVTRYSDKFHSPKNNGTSSNWRSIFNMFYQMGDGSLLLKLIWGILHAEIEQKPSLKTMSGLFRLVIALDAKTSRLSEGEIVQLSRCIAGYIIKASFVYYDSFVSTNLNCAADKMRSFQYLMKPFLVLIRRNSRVMHHALELISSPREYPSVAYFIDENCSLGLVRHVRIVVSILKYMYNDQGLVETLSSRESIVKTVFQNVENLLALSAPDLTNEDMRDLSSAVGHVKVRFMG